MSAQPPLTGYRALDLTTFEENICGRMMADMGVDVIKVERPGGDVTRNRGPFWKDEPHPEKSLFWFAYNRGKRSVTLDIRHPEGKKIFLEMVKRADWVLESFPPGTMEELGLGYETLREVNPRIILTSMTPFGHDGPFRDFKGPDLVLSALGGASYLAGYPDREPVRISYPQYHFHTGAEACAASMIAHWHRVRTGKGQHVVVAGVLTVIRTLMNATGFPVMMGISPQRVGPWAKSVHTQTPTTYPCKDGYVTMMLSGGQTGAPSMRALIAWMQECGAKTEVIASVNWEELDYASMGEDAQKLIDDVVEEINQFFLTKTKAELYQGAVERRILLAPINDAGDLLDDIQLQARDYWNVIEQEGMGKIRYPGDWIKATATPLNTSVGAPRIGQHNLEVYEQEMGYSREQLILLKEAGVI